MSHVSERLRQARAALDRGEHRRAIQLCEQLRANERVSDAQLTEIFALLGRAHVGLGEHDTALAFLKRADRDAHTLAAARDAYAALGDTGDPSALFAQGDARRARRLRRLVLGVVAGLVGIGACGFCVAPCASWLWVGGEMGLDFEAAAAEGAARGRSGTVATCEQAFLASLLDCAGLGTFEDEPPRECTLGFLSFYSCIEATSGWDAYCEAVPAPEPEREAHAWARARCEAYAADHGATGDLATDFLEDCEPQLVVMPAYCADPSILRSAE